MFVTGHKKITSVVTLCKEPITPKDAGKTNGSDEALMRAYLTGDSSAFDAIYRQYSGRVYGYLLGKLKSREEADEVFQAVFLKFHQSRGKYDPKYPVLQWLFVISRSAYIDHLRKRRREVPLDDEVRVENSDIAMSHTESSPALSRQEDTSLLLKNLSPEQQQIVSLRVLDELSYAQIAAQVGKSQPTVRQIFSRAVKRLRVSRSDS